jgi:hypothetical protein
MSQQRYTDEECEELFTLLFPNGFAGKDVLEELAPVGWSQSPLRLAAHPTLEQVYEETVRILGNLDAFPLTKRDAPRKPPTMEEVAARYEESPIEVESEVRELIGMCVWDIFSHNNDVLSPDGRTVDIGSFRGAAGFIADRLNREIGDNQYDYMDFYMGSIWIFRRADLTPVYELIFRRLKDRRFTWRYDFPEVRVVQLRGGEESPAVEKMKAELKESHRRAIEEAKKNPPPPAVAAHENVYGCLPRGWPPRSSSE